MTPIESTPPVASFQQTDQVEAAKKLFAEILAWRVENRPDLVGPADIPVALPSGVAEACLVVLYTSLHKRSALARQISM